jgi:hypothetical protein
MCWLIFDPARKRRIRNTPAAPPDRREQIVRANDPIAIPHEVDQQVERLRFEGNRRAAAAELTSVGIEGV